MVRRVVRGRLVASAVVVALITAVGACAGSSTSSTGSSGTTGKTVADPTDKTLLVRTCPAVPDTGQEAEGITVVHAFDGTDGGASWGSVNVLGDELFGRTLLGGQHNEGVIFRVRTDGSGFQAPVSFGSGADNGEGRQPHHDSMLWDGTRFWGTTLEGGRTDNGVIYTYDPATDAYAPVHVFAGDPDDAGQPHSGMVADGDRYYVMTGAGGKHGHGAILELDPATRRTRLVHSFKKEEGDNGHGNLTVGSDGRTLYGMTRSGGDHDTGVIFSFDPKDEKYRVLRNFGDANDPSDGASPDHGNLTLVDGRLWGMTSFGGPNGKGALFHIGEDGSGFTIVHGFGGRAGDVPDGEEPHGSLVRQGDWLYGTGYSGGRYGVGTVFRIRTDGSGYQVLASFGGSITGGFPKDNVTFSADGSRMYGVTIAGGEHDPNCNQADGTIFSLPTPH